MASHKYICRKKTSDDKSKTLKSGVLDPITETLMTQKILHQDDSNSDQSANDSYMGDTRTSVRKTDKSKRTTKVRNRADHTKLIKMICKSILDGTIPLESHHVSALKLHKNFVRKIAYRPMKEARNVIQKDGRSLQTVLDLVVSILVSLLV